MKDDEKLKTLSLLPGDYRFNAGPENGHYLVRTIDNKLCVGRDSE